MTSFTEKAKSWPRVTTADELAEHLEGVRPYRYKDYDWTANPPCHASASGTSFHFGDHPDGGITLGCWAPGCAGAGYYDRVEDALGVAIQIRKPNGELRYGGRLRGGKRRRQQNEHPTRPIVVYDDELQTLGDLYEAPYWFVGDGKKGAVWTNAKGKRVAMRQSANGGKDLHQCRYGARKYPAKQGSGKPARLMSWISYLDIAAGINSSRELERKGCRPCFALSASESVPCNHRLIILDLDYKPVDDEEGIGLKIGRSIISRVTGLNILFFASPSGKGAHLIMRHNLPAGTELRRSYPKVPRHGAHVDIFASGDLRLVAWRVDSREDAGDDATPLPVVNGKMLSWLIKGKE